MKNKNEKISNHLRDAIIIANYEVNIMKHSYNQKNWKILFLQN
ncbi:hypothetical protein [Spiroplasma poulsonii]|nr:hypothetical protein [Spiroplasma poulsonii]